jgi:hypothetical protein
MPTGYALAEPERWIMINQRHCPFCRTPAGSGCPHLALAVEGRDFVRRCVDRCQAQSLWQVICQQARDGKASPDVQDFTWLETAFCERFLKHLRWFGGLDYEWRTGPQLDQGGFWVLLWSKDPQRLWWELRDEFERNSTKIALVAQQQSSPWLIWLSPR